MRTAVRKEVSTFGSFPSTFRHEVCHNLDFKTFGLIGWWHRRDFYERAGVLYHHARETPLKKLFWVHILYLLSIIATSLVSFRVDSVWRIDTAGFQTG
jgi:hypothetical protein